MKCKPFDRSDNADFYVVNYRYYFLSWRDNANRISSSFIWLKQITFSPNQKVHFSPKKLTAAHIFSLLRTEDML